MDQEIHHGGSKKALYIFLCSLLGILLFVILQKSATLLLAELFSSFDGSSFEGYTSDVIRFETFTYILALFFGGWYGVWLGLHWYDIVYEKGRGGLLYAFWGNMVRDHGSVPKPKAQAVPEQPKKNPVPASSSWRFDDLVKMSAAVVKNDQEWSTKVSVKPKKEMAPVRAAAPVKKVVKKTTQVKTAALDTAEMVKPKKTASARKKTSAKSSSSIK